LPVGRRRRRCCSRVLLRTQLDVRAVLVDEFLRDALDHGELIDALERAVLLAIADDCLGLGRTDAVQRLGKRRGIGGVDVDRLGLHHLNHEQRRDQRGNEMFEFE